MSGATPVSTLSARRRHPLAGVVVLLLTLVALGGVYAALAPPSSAGVGSQDTEGVRSGQQLFAIGCAFCHGLNGEGQTQGDGTLLGPSLIGVGAAAVDFQVGTGRMPLAAPGAQAADKETLYTEDEIAALAAYVASLGPGPAIPDESDYDISDADVAMGGELFRTNCASCHNSTGQGGALTAGKNAPPLNTAEAVHIYEAMLTGPASMPVFSDETITPEQKRDIIAYIESIRAEPNPGGLGLGRIGPVSEGLWAWLVGIGGMIGAAVWIGAKST